MENGLLNADKRGLNALELLEAENVVALKLSNSVRSLRFYDPQDESRFIDLDKNQVLQFARQLNELASGLAVPGVDYQPAS